MVRESMLFSKPNYSVQEVNAAGRLLATSMDSPDLWTEDGFRQYRHAVGVINNWRSAHAYPLNTFAVNLRHIARNQEAEPLLAQRIKRLASIGTKLELFPKMKLSQMQDLGGCRAIMSDLHGVRSVVAYDESVSKIKHERLEPDDYITRPKVSGYRGVHLVYRYYSDKKEWYNGLKIEMQIRSRLQHAWATAVETVGMFSGQALKSSLGSDDWRRFFSLMGSVIAQREGTPLIPGTPDDFDELRKEVRHFATSLQVSRRLRGYSRALKSISSLEHAARYYLLQLDPSGGSLLITGFSLGQTEEAQAAYAEAEADAKQKRGADAVLVSVESVTSLRKAYPNYFADTGVFVELMEQALSGRVKPISN